MLLRKKYFFNEAFQMSLELICLKYYKCAEFVENKLFFYYKILTLKRLCYILRDGCQGVLFWTNASYLDYCI